VADRAPSLCGAAERTLWLTSRRATAVVTPPLLREDPVAAVVVTHNRLDDLKRCIAALRMQTYSAISITVVDNASTDETLNFLRRQPNIAVVHLPCNAGGAGGFKAGMTAAAQTEAQWWWIMDDDCRPATDALEQLVRTCVRGESEMLAGAAPTVQYEDEESRCGSRWARTGRRAVRYCDSQIDCAPFLGLLLRANACKAVGPVRDDFFIYCDDTEYCRRLQRHNFYLVAAPDAVVAHPSAHGRPAPWREYYRARNGLVIARMWYPSPLTNAMTIMGSLINESRIIVALMIRRRASRAIIVMRLRGMRDALLGRMGPRVLPEASSDENA
jgi:rhamnopyranosyl-N-acetylglucosaminyl-diphospho-decaprenol beta-1,3/1,4-galactofuranosyltransferase